jgi:hypothetical protein
MGSDRRAVRFELSGAMLLLAVVPYRGELWRGLRARRAA